MVQWYRSCGALLLLVSLMAPFADGAELNGVIRTIDSKLGRLVVESTDYPSPIVVQLSPELLFRRRQGQLPGCVRRNNTVRLEGVWHADTQTFQASSICGAGHRHDPTGVRNRIGRGCQLHDRGTHKVAP